jgi:hypothetical protein
MLCITHERMRDIAIGGLDHVQRLAFIPKYRIVRTDMRLASLNIRILFLYDNSKGLVHQPWISLNYRAIPKLQNTISLGCIISFSELIFLF